MASSGPEVVTVYYHVEEDGGWSAESPEAPGYMAYAPTLEECRERVREGLAFFLDRPIAIYDPAESLLGSPAVGAWGQVAGSFGVVSWALSYPAEERLRGIDPNLGIPSDQAASAA